MKTHFEGKDFRLMCIFLRRIAYQLKRSRPIHGASEEKKRERKKNEEIHRFEIHPLQFKTMDLSSTANLTNCVQNGIQSVNGIHKTCYPYRPSYHIPLINFVDAVNFVSFFSSS